MEAGRPAPSERADDRAISVGALDADLLDAVVRLARLFDSPAEARFLAPLIKRELVYRLMLGGQEERLGYIAALGGNTHRIVNAIGRFRREYDRNLRMETVAGDLGMSVSSFHHHFKAVTGLSPPNFRRRALQEAAGSCSTNNPDAASTAFRVATTMPPTSAGNTKRLFGLPPMQVQDGRGCGRPARHRRHPRNFVVDPGERPAGTGGAQSPPWPAPRRWPSR
ncbi:MAG: AraC family transcriptional regulator [Caldilineaceae bacterium]